MKLHEIYNAFLYNTKMSHLAMQIVCSLRSRPSDYEISRVREKHFLYNNKKYTGGRGEVLTHFVRSGLVRYPCAGDTPANS